MSIPQATHAAFSDAIERGDLPAVDALILKHPELVNHSNWTPPPIHCAVLWDQPEIAERLLDSGADIEMLDPDRKTTPLRYAIVFGKLRLIPLLISRGANSGAIVEGGTTALQLARMAADGEFADFDDTPPVEAYGDIIKLLE